MAKILSSIDIGSSNIICLISTISDDGKICIKGASIHKSYGVQNGDIVDIKKAVEAIGETLEKTEKLANKNINNLIVNVGNNSFLTKIEKADKNITNSSKINKKDIRSLAKTIQKNLSNKNKSLIHMTSVSSFVDNIEVSNPIGIQGNNLKVSFNTVYVDSKKIKTIADCFGKFNIDIDNYVFDAYAASLAVLKDYEKKNGSLVINIGADKTSFAIMNNNKFIFGGSIKLAGNTITNDIKYILKIAYDLAEKVKILNTNFYLNDRERNEIIKLDNIDNEDSFNAAMEKKGLINDIVKDRIEEIIKIILVQIIDKNGYNNKFDNIVLTGGTANILGLENYIKKITNIKTRIGYVNNFYTDQIIDKKELEKPSYATSIGLLKFAASAFENNNNIENYKNSDSFFDGIISFLKDLFIN